jgi:hypothetical protein
MARRLDSRARRALCAVLAQLQVGPTQRAGSDTLQERSGSAHRLLLTDLKARGLLADTLVLRGQRTSAGVYPLD